MINKIPISDYLAGSSQRKLAALTGLSQGRISQLNSSGDFVMVVKDKNGNFSLEITKTTVLKGNSS